MQGDERRRFCASCKLHVHNLSGMTADDATALLRQAGGGRVCVRFFRRADGTVLTRDCPVGLRQKMRRTLARAAALGLALWTAACGQKAAVAAPSTVPLQGAVPQLMPLQGEVEMGDVLVPNPPKPEPHEIMGKVAAPQQPPKK